MRKKKKETRNSENAASFFLSLFRFFSLWGEKRGSRRWTMPMYGMQRGEREREEKTVVYGFQAEIALLF